MKVNVGTIDRVVRIILGIALIAFALGFIGAGASWRWVGWIGVGPLLRAIACSCPLYSMLGMSTCPMKKA